MTEVDAEKMLKVLNAFWKAVSNVFRDDWALPPRLSRLMHGAGIFSVGLLMDAIGERHWASILKSL